MATRIAGASVFQFRRGLNQESTDLALGASSGLISTAEGALVKFTLTGANAVPGNFTAVTLPSTPTALNGVCRVSETEWYAVGTNGSAFLYNGTTATAVTTPAGNDLLAVDCGTGGGPVIACGRGGTVLRLQGGAFVSLAFPQSTDLTSCRAAGGSIFVSGDNLFARHQAGAWTTSLAARPNLTALVAVGPGEVYGVSGAEVFRFDGATWVSRLTCRAATEGWRAGGQSSGVRGYRRRRRRGAVKEMMSKTKGFAMAELSERFKIRAPLRCDGIGRLDCAEDTESGQRMAVRWLPLEANGDAAVRAAERLPEHPTFPRIRQTGISADKAFLAMDFPDGNLLSTRLGEALSGELLLEMGAQISDALAMIHSQGVFHGELSAESVLMVPKGKAFSVGHAAGHRQPADRPPWRRAPDAPAGAHGGLPRP